MLVKRENNGKKEICGAGPKVKPVDPSNENGYLWVSGSIGEPLCCETNNKVEKEKTINEDLIT